jgi:hypothetical protein
MTSPAYTIARYLETEGFGEWANDINVSLEPNEPVECITLYDTGGQDPDSDEQDVFNKTIQIRVRTLNYLETYTKLEQIRDLLIKQTIAGINGIWMQGDILYIGRDDNDRHLFTTNFRLLIQGN